VADNLPYRKCVGIMLLNSSRMIFVGRCKNNRSEVWLMPQGGIDGGEHPEQAVMRELKEEIGTDKAEIIAKSNKWYNYDVPEELRVKLLGGKYRGQTQKWFVLKFTGEDSDIDINTETPEFMEWKWIQSSSVPFLIVPYMRKLYQDVISEFRQLGYIS